MDFGKIIKKSFENVKKYRYLWGLGILSALAGGFGNIPSSTSNIGSFQADPMDTSMQQVADWFKTNADLITGVSILSLLILVVFIYLSLRSDAGMIKSVDKIEKKEAFKNFSQAWKASEGFAGKLFILGLLAGVAVLAWILVLIILPTVLMLLIPALPMYILGGIVIFAGATGLIVLGLGLLPTVEYAKRKIVLSKARPLDALLDSWTQMRKNLGNSILAILLYFVISAVISFVIGLVAVIIGGILSAIGVAVYSSLGLTSTIIYGIILGIPLLALIVTISGVAQAYFSSYWTLIYFDLEK